MKLQPLDDRIVVRPSEAEETTASGLVIAVGELFGGGLAPMIGGQIAQHFGIQDILWLPIGAATLGFFLCLSLRETRAGMVRSAEPAG